MKHRLTLLIAATSFLFAVAYRAPSAEQRPLSVAPQQSPSVRTQRQPSTTGDRQSHQAVLAKYCVTCHNQRVKTAGLALDTLDLADVGESR